MQELYKAPYLEIFRDQETGILHLDWQGYQSFDSGIAGCDRVLEEISKHRAEKILNDNTRVRGLWMASAEWAARIWFPRLKNAGMRRFAWVYSPAKFSRISTDTALSAMDPEQFGVRVFDSKTDALDWLSAVD